MTERSSGPGLRSFRAGEKRRLQLLHVLMGAPNVLILDEPTNDLDIQTLTILEDYLDGFPGIVIIVSHDRYFLDRTVRRIFSFEKDGKLCRYEGGYSDYLAARERREEEVSEQEKFRVTGKRDEGGKGSGRGKPRHEEKLKFSYKEQREYETIDGDIEALENRLAELDGQIEEAATRYTQLEELTREKEKGSGTAG